ncbi:MAG: Ig-like domain-containing protein [Thermoleophilia bacterium]
MRTLARTGTALAAAAAALTVALPAALAVPPAAPGTPDLVPASDSGPSPLDNITSDGTPSFVVDAGASSFGMTVTLYRTEKNDVSTKAAVGTGLVAADGTAQVTATSTGDGTYVFTATTKNGTNEESPVSTGLDVQIDTTAPVLLAAPTLVNFVGADPTMTYTQTPTFALAGEPGATIEIYEAATLLGSGVVGQWTSSSAASSDTALVTLSTALADGQHTVYAVQVDLAGNASQPSPGTTVTIDSQPPTVSQPDLLAADDDGASSTDDTTTNPRPRFVVTTEPGARTVVYENGLALGSATADASGIATVRVSDVQWLDPGVHCIYAAALDPLGNGSADSTELCVTILRGAAPFTSNLGLELDGDVLKTTVTSSLAGKLRLAVVRSGRTVASRTLRVKPGRTTVRLVLPGSLRKVRRVRVVGSLRSSDGRRTVFARTVRR